MTGACQRMIPSRARHAIIRAKASRNRAGLVAVLTGDIGTRNAMPLINLAWKKEFFWDGTRYHIA
ncbi:MAG: hypothetical protein WDN00_16470 [Limisphaerales bacterium]